MNFASLLRGRVAERVLVTLLERGGYRVTRLGIEEIFDEIKLLSQSEYLALGLPPALRTLPDILVADPGVSWAALVELKYRRCFDDAVARELHATLSHQREFWPQSHAVIMIAEPFVEGGRFHQDYIRYVKPGATDKLLWRPPSDSYSDERSWMSPVWNSLPTILSLFKADHIDTSSDEGRKRSWEFFSAMDYITGALKELKNF
jgi:hypothetical protein